MAMAIASLVNGLWTHFVMAMATERNTHICNFTVNIAIAIGHHMNSVIFVCTKPIHDDNDSVAIKNHLV